MEAYFAGTGKTFDEGAEELIQHREAVEEGEKPGRKQFRSFWREMYDTLPKRNSKTVYNYVYRLLQNATRDHGAWPPEQIEALVELVSIHGRRWEYVSRQLNRDPAVCHTKYKQCEAEGLTISWDEHASLELLLSMIAYRVSGKTTKLKLDWVKIGEEIGRTPDSCEWQW